jgi:hypothetical protein
VVITILEASFIVQRVSVSSTPSPGPDDGVDLTETFCTINYASNIVITIHTLRWGWSYVLEFEQPARYGKYKKTPEMSKLRASPRQYSLVSDCTTLSHLKTVHDWGPKYLPAPYTYTNFPLQYGPHYGGP